jgi:hypothetical protein
MLVSLNAGMVELVARRERLRPVHFDLRDLRDMLTYPQRPVLTREEGRRRGTGTWAGRVYTQGKKAAFADHVDPGTLLGIVSAMPRVPCGALLRAWSNSGSHQEDRLATKLLVLQNIQYMSMYSWKFRKLDPCHCGYGLDKIRQ